MAVDGAKGLGIAGLILAVGLLVAIAGVGTVIGDSSTTDDAAAESLEATPESIDGLSSISGESVPETLEGDVTTPPVTVDDRLLVGTDRGLYVVADGDVESFVATKPVRDATLLEDDLAVVLVEDEQFPNVVAVDVGDGEIRWTASHDRETYSNDFGYVDQQLPAFDAEPIGDGTGDVAVALGNAVVAVDGDDGDRLWTTEADHAVWQLESAGDRIFAGTQGGDLVSLDADDGDRLEATRLADPFEHDQMGDIPRSVWDVEVVSVDGQDRVAVTTEDGTAAVVDPDDLTVDWQERVVEFDDRALASYYSGSGADRRGVPTLPGDGAYFNVELTVVDDGDTALAVDVAVDERAGVRVLRDETNALHLLDASSGSVEWSTDDAPLGDVGNVAYAPDVDGGSLLVPHVPAEGSQEITVVDRADGTTGESIDVRAVAGEEWHHRGGPGADRESGYVAIDDDEVVVTSTTGDLTAVDDTGSIQWTVPSVRDVEVRQADVLGDGVDDYLLVSQNARERATQTRSLVLRSGADGSVAWTQSIDVDAYHERGGLENVQTIDGDDGLDVLALQRSPETRDEPDDETGDAVVVLSGDDGELLHQYELLDDGDPVPLTSVAGIGDVAGDGNENAIVAEQDAVHVLDLETGDLDWSRVYQQRGPGDEQEWSPFEGTRDVQYHAVGDDAVVAFARGEEEMVLLEPTLTGGDLSVEERNRFEFGGEYTDRGVDSLGDLTGDGYDELLVPRSADGDLGLTAIAPSTGDVLASFDEAHQLSVTSADADFTGDGTTGLIAYQGGGDNELSVVDGGSELWSTEMEHPVGGVTIPAAAVGDVSGDGTDDVAVVRSSRERGAWVDVHDVQTGDAFERVVLEPRAADDRSDPGPGTYAQRIPDRTGDGTPELGVVAPTDGTADGVQFFVVDPHAGETLLGGDGEKRAFVDIGDDVGMLRSDAGIRPVDVTAGVTIDEPEGASELELAWTHDADADHVSTVIVGDRPVTITDDESATLRLPAGEHEITVQSIREDGITVYDTVTVTVDSESSADLLLYGATGLSVAVLFAIGLVPELFERRRR